MTRCTAQLLASLACFGSLTEAQIEELRPHFEDVDVPAEAIVFREGDPGDGLFIVVEGRLEVARRTPAGPERVLNTINQGDVVGELGLLTDRPRSATARALAPTHLVKLPKEAYAGLIGDDSLPALKLTLELTRELSRRLLETSEQLVAGEDGDEAVPLLTEFEAFRRHIIPTWSF